MPVFTGGNLCNVDYLEEKRDFWMRILEESSPEYIKQIISLWRDCYSDDIQDSVLRPLSPRHDCSRSGECCLDALEKNL